MTVRHTRAPQPATTALSCAPATRRCAPPALAVIVGVAAVAAAALLSGCASSANAAGELKPDQSRSASASPALTSSKSTPSQPAPTAGSTAGVDKRSQPPAGIAGGRTKGPVSAELRAVAESVIARYIAETPGAELVSVDVTLERGNDSEADALVRYEGETLSMFVRLKHEGSTWKVSYATSVPAYTK